LILWRLTDGKPGHEKQTLGLSRALEALAQARTITLAAPPRGRSLAYWALGRFPPGAGLPDPDLLLGAGHATHPALLAARRARGGRAVVLMRPSLPLALFDLCLIPEHDGPPLRKNVLATRGVLNAVVPSAGHKADEGLILVGGTSAHFGWDDRLVAGQVAEIVHAAPEVRWRLTDSRRTPAGFLDGLRAMALPNLAIHPHATTSPGWLEAALAETGQAWVSEDSVSMLYEALTAGCPVGLLRLPAGRPSRVGRGVARLLEEGWITPIETWRQGRRLAPPPGRFDEAGRCAREIVERWFS